MEPYVLPDLLTTAAGEPVESVHAWEQQRRPEILELFSRNVYGRTPATRVVIEYERGLTRSALDGAAVVREAVAQFGDPPSRITVPILIYLPAGLDRPAPAFLALNFWGNHEVAHDPAITLSTSWMRPVEQMGIVDNRATESSRGVMARRWPLRRILERGYAVATAHYGDFCLDLDDGYSSGAHRLFGTTGPERRPDQWAAIGAWAWGMSAVLDCMSFEPDVDQTAVIALGHSRLGKTALWAAAQDERFAMAVSNGSGCGGASLFRHTLGERLHVLSRIRPYWFCPAFAGYELREHDLPVDQHMLIAAIAPRPVYVASAAGDKWADPRGEYLAALHASRAYGLYGKQGLAGAEFPELDQVVIGDLSYHCRSGKHDLTGYDWERFMDAADLALPTVRR